MATDSAAPHRRSVWTGVRLADGDDGATQHLPVAPGGTGRTVTTPDPVATQSPSPIPGSAPVRSQSTAWAWMPWALASVVVGLVITVIVFRVLAGADLFPEVVENAIALPVAAVVGAMIVGRRARNIVGWMLLVSALGSAGHTASRL